MEPSNVQGVNEDFRASARSMIHTVNAPGLVEVAYVDALVDYAVLLGDVIGTAHLVTTLLRPVVTHVCEYQDDLVARVSF